MSWNYCEAIDRIGSGPERDRVALCHENNEITFAELRRRSRGIGAWLQGQGLDEHSHVGHYMRNSNAYLETFVGSGLVGHAHVNVNYRYQDRELQDLCNALDISVLVYDAEFSDRVARIKPQLQKTVAFVEVCDGDANNAFATRLCDAYDYPAEGLVQDTAGDNQLLIATGGTTGLPKGTQWRQADVWNKMGVCIHGVMEQAALEAPPATLDEYLEVLYTLEPVLPVLPLCPLMHGTGLLASLNALAQGTTVVTIANPRFDPDECLDLVARYRIGRLIIVGDVFAMPLLDALERRGDGSLDSVNIVISSGAILSDDSRVRFQRVREDMVVYDTLGSSESIGVGVATREAGVFIPLPTTRVFADDMVEILPGEEGIGIAYSGGYSPIGYYNEPEKSAETFVTIDGQNYVNTGDRCRFRPDGMLELLGRDSTVVNSGGEKVYTVEVERELICHPAISDAVVVGLPHPRFGKMVVAVVEGPGLTDGSIDVESIRSFLRERLAGYKVPKHIYVTDAVTRHANGKPDYPLIESYAAACLSRQEA